MELNNEEKDLLYKYIDAYKKLFNDIDNLEKKIYDKKQEILKMESSLIQIEREKEFILFEINQLRKDETEYVVDLKMKYGEENINADTLKKLLDL
jgi:regulator of replication initiation timing